MAGPNEKAVGDAIYLGPKFVNFVQKCIKQCFMYAMLFQGKLLLLVQFGGGWATKMVSTAVLQSTERTASKKVVTLNLLATPLQEQQPLQSLQLWPTIQHLLRRIMKRIANTREEPTTPTTR